MIDYEDIQQRVTLRYQRRYRFILHTVVYAMGIFAFAARMSSEGFFLWTLLWLLHALWISYRTNLENAIKEELELERERYHKAKRDQIFSTQRLHAPELEGEDDSYPSRYTHQ